MFQIKNSEFTFYTTVTQIMNIPDEFIADTVVGVLERKNIVPVHINHVRLPVVNDSVQVITTVQLSDEDAFAYNLVGELFFRERIERIISAESTRKFKELLKYYSAGVKHPT